MIPLTLKFSCWRKDVLRSIGFTRTAGLFLTFLLLSIAQMSLAVEPPPCGGDTVDRCWTGAASGFWSNPNNWTPVGVPQNGEVLRFHNGHNITMVNDLPNLVVSALWLFDFSYDLSGNLITFAGAGGTAPYASGIVNFGGDDSHTTTIHCPISLGADTTFESGGIAGSPIKLILKGPIDLGGHTLYLRSDEVDGRIEVSSVIGGNGDVVVRAESPSSIEFNGLGNTFHGTLFVGFGALGDIFFNKSSGVVVNDALVIRGSTEPGFLKLARPQQIGDEATVTLVNGGQLLMQGHNETIGHLVLSNAPSSTVPVVLDTGTATLSVLGNVSSWNLASGVIPTIKGRINLPGGRHTLEMNGNSFYSLDVAGEITGSGDLNKIGAKAMTLSTNNTFTGSLSIDEGVVEARHSQAFGTTSGGVTLTGQGSLTLNEVVVNGETLSVRGTRSVTANTDGSLLSGRGLSGWGGRIELQTNLVVNSTDLCLLGGPVVGPGGFEFIGSRHSLSGAAVQPNPSTFTGVTRVVCERLQLSEERPLRGPLVVGGGFGGPYEVRWAFPSRNSGVPEVTVHPNGFVNLNGRDETFTRLVMHGGRVATGTGFVSVARIITNPTNVTATVEGTLVLASSPTTEFTVADGAATPDLAISAVITGGFSNTGVVKAGDGELRLSGANNYGGTTQIDAGVVHIQNNTSLGTPGFGTTVRDGATLQIEFVGALAEPLNISGAGRGGTLGALNLMAATGVGANMVMAGPTTVRVDQQFAIISGVISGTGPFTKIGTGTLQFGGGAGAANTYSGDTLVRAGGLVPAKGAGVTTVPGRLVIGGGGGLFETPAVVRHFSSFTIAGGVTVNRGGLWDLNGFSEDFNGALLQGGSALALIGGGDVQTGAGTLTLPAGDVTVGPGIASPSPSSSIAGNLVLQPGTHRFIVQGGFFVGGSPTPELIVSAAIGQQPLGAAGVTKEGSGTIRLSGANSFSGAMTVNDGELEAAHALALGTAAGGTFVNGDASLTLDGGFEVVGETLTLDSSNPAALRSAGPVTNVWSGNIVLQRTAGIRITDPPGAFTHFGGVGNFDTTFISGPGGFTKSGPGTFFITGLFGGNNYTGPTTVTEGVLAALRSGPNLSRNIAVTGANAVLRTGRPGSIFTAVRTVLPTGASVAIEDGALWTMNGTNFETIDQLRGDGRLAIGINGALTISNTVSCTFSGSISGAGALNKRGLATLQLTGNSPDYTGAATVFDGTYKVDAQVLNSPVTVQSGAILRGGGAVGDVTAFESGAVVLVDSTTPGHLGGTLNVGNLTMFSGGTSGASVGFEFFGPSAIGGDDRLIARGGVDVTSTRVSLAVNYAPHEGDVFTVLQKDSAGPITGTFTLWPEGAVREQSGYPLRATYLGGDGNDFTLTVTNLPLQGGGASLVTSAGSSLGPEDCSQLWLVVTNRGGVPLTGLRGQLRSLTEGILVTGAESAYPILAPNARGSNATPFQIRTAPSFPCGGGAQFELILTASNSPPTAITYTLPGASGFGLSFDGRNDEVEVARTAFTGIVNNFTIELWANPAGNRTVTAETNAGVSGVNVALRQLQRFAVFPDRGNLAYGATHVSAGLSIGRNGISTYEQGTNHLPSRLVYSNALSGWTHVALVYANRRPQLYVNGDLVRSSSLASLFPNVHPSASLGGSSQGDYGNFDGQLDEVRIWNVALSQAQIQTNLRHALTGTESGLVTYFRCDEAGGNVLVDSAPAGPNFNGTLTDGAAFVFPGVVPFGDDACHSGGACESCSVVSGTFDATALESLRQLTVTGLPSLCSPPKACPGFDEFPDAPVRHILHHFTNATPAELCVSAQLRLDCPEAPTGLVGVAAYLGEFRINQPCSSYLGDDGAFGSPPPPFSFRVPPRTNIVLVVTARDTNLLCNTYTLELFGLPCPPPALHMARLAETNQVRLQWSSAYPDFQLQSAAALNRPSPPGFAPVATLPVLSGGKFTVTNATAGQRQFFQLVK